MLNVNGQPLNVTVFPDKTSQVWKLNLKPQLSLNVIWEFQSEAELIHLAQLKDLYDSIGGEFSSLLIKYLPYARQDKPISDDATFALHTFARILNGMCFNMITIFDPHSPVATDLIRNSRAVYATRRLVQVIEEVKPETLCYPDKGAVSKYTEVPIYNMYRYIYGEKVRDQATGNILSYKVVGDCAGKTVLIVDDICDGGATFKFLAKDLLAAGAKSVVLFVSHGIFSKGLKPLFEAGIQRIYTQDGEASEVQGHIAYRRL